MEDLELRSTIYEHIVETGAIPLRSEMSEWLDDGDALDDQLRRLHDGHLLVLDDRPRRRGEIRMALPFSAIPTDFRVETRLGAWFANCAWDAFAIAAALHEDAHITSTWSDTGDGLELRVVDGELEDPAGFVHFAIPAAHWWDDVVET